MFKCINHLPTIWQWKMTNPTVGPCRNRKYKSLNHNVLYELQNVWRVRQTLSYGSYNEPDLPTLPFMTFAFSSTAKWFIWLVLTIWEPITELSMWNTLTIITGELVCSRTCWYTWKSVTHIMYVLIVQFYSFYRTCVSTSLQMLPSK